MSADLQQLLDKSVPDAVVQDLDGSFVMEVDYFQLPQLCELMRAHADVRNLPGWDPNSVQLRDLTDPVCRLSLMLLGTWSVEPALFPSLGLYIDSEQNPIDLQTVDRVQTSARVDVVLNTARATIVAATYGIATELRIGDQMIGLGSFVAQRVELDTRALVARIEPFPEIVLNSELSMVLDPAGARISAAPVSIDDLGYRRLDESGQD